MVSAEHHQVYGERELTSIEVPLPLSRPRANCFYSSVVLNNSWASCFGASDGPRDDKYVKIVHLKKLTTKAMSLAAMDIPITGCCQMALGW